MKIWRTTYEEFEKRFGGLNRLRIRRKDRNLVHYNNSIVPIRYRTNICFNPKKSCTYVGLTCLGYFDTFGPKETDLTIVIRFNGYIDADELTYENFGYKEGLNAVFEELEMDWREKLDSRKEN